MVHSRGVSAQGMSSRLGARELDHAGIDKDRFQVL